MPTISETAEFEVKADQLNMRTSTNGDVINITGINLTKEQAASLAWLVNQEDVTLLVEVKVKP